MRASVPLALVGLLLISCGYRVVGSGSPFGPEVDRIQIRPLVNRSKEPALTRILSEALIEEFDRRGILRPDPSDTIEGSALRLGGTVRDFTDRPVAFSSVGIAVEHEMRLVVDLDLVREPTAVHEVARRAGRAALPPDTPQETAAPIWREHRIVLTERFLTSADPGVHESNKERALLRMAAELAGRVHDALLQTF